MHKSNRKGFTLIELLVVIAIIAVLAVVVILTLNPAELLRQARDSNRISDLNTVKSAISLYLADVASPSVSSSCSYSYAATTSTGDCNGRYLSSSTPNVNSASMGSGVYNVSSTGWIPINFNGISSGAPIGNLPHDPSNAYSGSSTTSYYYTYKGSSTPLTFELVANMESSKYKNGGGSDVESTDGGRLINEYETGTDIGGGI
jgi:prepilin-type N-terminal cleavage/methylation domain-containing protein